MNRSLLAAGVALALSLPLVACHSADRSQVPMVNESGVEVGELAPTVSFLDAEGQRVRLTDYTRSGPVVLNFYRGNWCPYCNTALDGWDQNADEFARENATIISVSPESIPELKTTAGAHETIVLSDPNHAAARAFGINFTVDDETRERYRGYGIDLATHNASGDWDLPVPATFVIDRRGRIRYAYANPDYKTRAHPEDVLEVVRGLE